MEAIQELSKGEFFKKNANSHVYVKGDYIDGHYICFEYHYPKNKSLAKCIPFDAMVIPVADKGGVFIEI